MGTNMLPSVFARPDAYVIVLRTEKGVYLYYTDSDSWSLNPVYAQVYSITGLQNLLDRWNAEHKLDAESLYAGISVMQISYTVNTCLKAPSEFI